MQTGDGDQRGSRSTLQKKTSSFSLLSPDGWSLRGKKRKQASRDADSLSLCSLDINFGNISGCSLVTGKDPAAELSRMVVEQSPLCLLVQRFKSGRSVTLDKGNNTMGKQVETERAAPSPPSSSTMKTRVITATVSNPSSSTTSSRASAAAPPPAKRRDSKLWSETFDVRLGETQTLSPKEIKRQEAIFELAQGEQDLVEDLKLAKKAYHDPMLKLKIMTEQELNQIFGTLDSLIPLHEDLLSRLRDARKPDGSTEHVGHILTAWLPCLSSYTPYCSNQVKAKALLDQKKQDRRVQDFLQRCRQSPFSRKLDLWNFLDIPRSRLVKYPLLLREILKHTPNDHLDQQHLDEAMLMVQSVVADINRRTGESECQYYKDRLLYTEDGQRDELIDQSRTLSCHGELKNNRGLKLHVFLFQDVLVITRSLSLNDQPVSYQLCRQPIPIRQLDLEDLSDGEMRVGGSIRGAFSNNERTKNFFRVSYRAGGQVLSHYFQASDAFNKQQWINCIRQAKEAAAQTGDQAGQCLDTGLGGEIGRLSGTGLSLRSDSGIEDEKGMWGEMETGGKEEEGPSAEKDLSLGKETEVGLTQETLCREMDTGLGVDRGTSLESDVELNMDSETRLTITETEAGEMQPGQDVSGEMGVEPGARTDWKIDGAGGDTVSRGTNDVPTSLISPASPTQEEEEVMEEDRSGTKEEEDSSMDIGEVGSPQDEELTHRC
ncbi:rho guanine nucleotide exchange factor 3 [Mastacembelus armatus]|uniref:rho guanine nucleotide exchange factor 3 n=1 Tax=Mastacembelus armatus TaxID=205130 RepID=UPI000E46530D|nr:rho guanine nucleotide exchange factor 3 [Mastacembelus armatus]